MPTKSLNIYLGYEFDSIKSKAHRSIQSFVRSASGKSDGPRTVVSSVLDLNADHVFRQLADVPVSLHDRLWIPEASLDQWPEALCESLDRGQVALGPSIDVLNPNILARLKQFENTKVLVPSLWVKEFFIDFCGLRSSRIHVWAAGVDHDYWKPTFPDTFRFLTVYQKSTIDESEMQFIKDLAGDLFLELKVIKYGDYKLKNFRNLLRDSRALIWAGSTESQALAQFESWAMNVPTLVRKARNFNNLGIGSESPYLSEETGLCTREDSITRTDLEIFSQRLDSFNPRAWVLRNATPAIARANLLSIFDED